MMPNQITFLKTPNHFKNYLVVFFLIFCSQAFALTEHIVSPASTDPNIQIATEDHYAYIETQIPALEKLFVFLPGTTAIPRNYRLIVQEAAAMGYHSIGLTYPNQEAINSAAICGSSIDFDCHARARGEIFDGTDRHVAVQVDTANSISNRLLKLLQKLHTDYPLEGWNLYFDNDSIFWNKIVISGHSQGGGHAAFIGHIRKVQRVVMFAAADFLPLLNQSPTWVTTLGLTPPKDYFGLAHELDELLDFNNIILPFWENLGMQPQNLLTLVDNSVPPFQNAQALFTKITPAINPQQFHNSMIVDVFTPKNAQGMPQLKSTWQYLLDVPTITATQEQNSHIMLPPFPNPSQNFIQFKTSNRLKKFEIFTQEGNLLQQNQFINKIDLSTLQNGNYWIRIYEEENIFLFPFLKIN